MATDEATTRDAPRPWWAADDDVATPVPTERPWETTSPRREPRWRRPSSLAALAVGAVVAFNLWSLRAEVGAVADLNDGSFQAAYVRWATDRIQQGRTPFDGLFTTLGLGFPAFHHYQVLPHVVTGLVGTVTGADTAYRWSLYLLLALWPVCIYVSARLMGIGLKAAVAAAVVAPFVMSVSGYGFERGSFLWRGYGMWTLLWGMWLMPLALALAWRAIDGRRSLVLAAAVTGFAITSHALTGYEALFIIAAFALVARGRIATRIVRMVAVVGGALASSAWLLIPTFRDKAWTRNGLPPGTFWTDSYGARKVLGWLVSGELLDHGRWPVLTILAGTGLIATVVRARRDPASRAILTIGIVSLLLYFGRPTFGDLVDLLPAHDDLFLHRMIVGVHLGGILLAGIGLATLARIVVDVARQQLPWPVPAPALAAGVVVLTVAGLAPAWNQIRTYDDVDRQWIEAQRVVDANDGADFATLVALTRTTSDRVYAGTRQDALGSTYKIGSVPAVIELTNLDATGIGFSGRIPALTEPSEARFDETNPANYQLFDARYLILPADHAPPAGATLISSAGRHRLYSMPTTGLLQVADTTAAIATSRQDIDVAVGAFLRSDGPTRGQYPLLTIDGVARGTPTLAPGTLPNGSPGSVQLTYGPGEDGIVGGTVTATRPAAVVLKMSAHGRWHATVDGTSAPVNVVAPGFMAVDVPAGQHRVEFTYDAVSGWETLGWFGVGGLVLVAIGVADRWTRARAIRRHSSRTAASAAD
jgi:hypothetical protein